MLVSEVVSIAKKSKTDLKRWVYTDVGIFNGLMETVDESIKYPAYTERTGETGDVILAGPTCDSLDIMYEHYKYQLPLSLEIGDRIFWLSTGAYTASLQRHRIQRLSTAEDPLPVMPTESGRPILPVAPNQPLIPQGTLHENNATLPYFALLCCWIWRPCGGYRGGEPGAEVGQCLAGVGGRDSVRAELDEAATLFKSAVTKQEWMKAVQSARARWAPLKSRVFKTATLLAVARCTGWRVRRHPVRYPVREQGGGG